MVNIKFRQIMRADILYALRGIMRADILYDLILEWLTVDAYIMPK
jgi:hypothetical protein